MIYPSHILCGFTAGFPAGSPLNRVRVLNLHPYFLQLDAILAIAL